MSTALENKDAYVPEEPTVDVPMSLLDIQMPETPESTKGQTSDGDRWESPRALKPVLGKVQAKKRLMAFANKYNVLPKVQQLGNKLGDGEKNNSCVSTDARSKGNLSTVVNNRCPSGRPKKKTEEKILAIEEIVREESKSKMLLATAMAAANLDEENGGRRRGHNMLQVVRGLRERSRKEDINTPRKNSSRPSIDQKYSERKQRHSKDGRRESSSRESRSRGRSKDQLNLKSSKDREHIKREREQKYDRDKQDEHKLEEGHGKKEEIKDKCGDDRDRHTETKERKEGTKEIVGNVEDKRSCLREKCNMWDRKGDDKDNKVKEKEIMKCNSWTELRNSGLPMEEVMLYKRHICSERPIKNRSPQDYSRSLEQMLMLSNHRLKRFSLIVDGIDGPKQYPPESVKVTKRGKTSQVLYCENPRISLLLNRQKIFQVIPTERREKITEISDAAVTGSQAEEFDNPQQVRDWYQKIPKTVANCKQHALINIKFPKSRWDSEDEEAPSPVMSLSKEAQKDDNQECNISNQEVASEEDPTDIIANINTISTSEIGSDKVGYTSSSIQSAGEEKLASEYEQFMKMVSSDIPAQIESNSERTFSPEKVITDSQSQSNYHEFDLEANHPMDKGYLFLTGRDSTALKASITAEVDERKRTDEREDSADLLTRIQKENEAERLDESHSIPSDWENVRIKVERMSDENSTSKQSKRKKKRKQRKRSSSSESTSTLSSSDTAEEKRKKKKRRKRKLSQDSSSSGSDSSESSASSSETSDSEKKRKKKRRKKKKAIKRKAKKKAKRASKAKKRRKRKVSTDSSSSDTMKSKGSNRKRSMRMSREKKEFEVSGLAVNDELNVEKPSVGILRATEVKGSEVRLKRIKEEISTKKGRTASFWEKEQLVATGKDIISPLVCEEEEGRVGEVRQEGEAKMEVGMVMGIGMGRGRARGLDMVMDEDVNIERGRYVEEWETDSVVTHRVKAQSKSETIDHSNLGLEKIENAGSGKVEKKVEGGRTKIGGERFASKRGQDEEIEERKKRKRDKGKRSSEEFLADWENESQRATDGMTLDDIKLSKKLEKLKRMGKEKWTETEFDTLNVPSLTQLEKEADKRNLLVDEWEVDSLEALPNLASARKKSNKYARRSEKEVRYDKKTDTYVAVCKESGREGKKRQDRLSAIRIWEEEQEEGEKEELLFVHGDTKQKKDEWDIEEEGGFVRDPVETNEKLVVVTSSKQAWFKEEEPTVKDEEKNKRTKKSRWDMGSQLDEKVEMKTPVMWEEECTEWTPAASNSTSTANTTNEVANARKTCDAKEEDVFVKKQRDIDLLGSMWTAQTQSVNVNDIKDSRVPSRSVDQLDTENRDGQSDLSGKALFLEANKELYSPSSPAPSQKSQDTDMENIVDVAGMPEHSKQAESSGNQKRDSPALATTFAGCVKPEDSLPLVSKEEEREPISFNIKNSVQLLNEQLCESAGRSLKPSRMDIFAEYESDDSQLTGTAGQNGLSKEEEPQEDNAALKLIPKQLLIKRSGESTKGKRHVDSPLEDPVQHAAALLTIQQKLLQSRALKADRGKSGEDGTRKSDSEIDHSQPLDTVTDTNTDMDGLLSRSAFVSSFKTTSPTASTKADVKKQEDKRVYQKTTRLTDDCARTDDKSRAVRERRRNSREDEEKRYDRSSEWRGRRSDDREKTAKKNYGNSRSSERGEMKDKPSPVDNRLKRRRSRSPWEREKSAGATGSRTWSWSRSKSRSRSRSRSRNQSRSRSRSWSRTRSRSRSRCRSQSRSRSRSPKRRTESRESREREGRSSKDEERFNRSKVPGGERRDKSLRSPSRIGYGKDSRNLNGKRSHNHERANSADKHREESKPYNPMEILRERNFELERRRENRAQGDEEADQAFWQYENENNARGGHDSQNFSNVQGAEFNYEDRSYYRDDSIERDIMEGPLRHTPKFVRRQSRSSSGSSVRRERVRERERERQRQWEKERNSAEADKFGRLDRKSDKLMRTRSSRLPSRSRRSPAPGEQSTDRYHTARARSRSRSRSWSRSKSRTRSRTRSRSRSHTPRRSRSNSRSRSRARTRSGSRSRSRTRSTSRSKPITPERIRNDDENRTEEKGRRIETIVQSAGGPPRIAGSLDGEMHINNDVDSAETAFQYPHQGEAGNEYYYSENNLTYPPCIDETSISSPKRLSLDDRLELELGIKKQESSGSSDYTGMFNPNVVTYPSTTAQQQHQRQVIYRQQGTVLQVGNVLQVVPADLNGTQSGSGERPNNATTAAPIRGSSQVVRVGNVLQVVPTSLDWGSGASGTGTTDQTAGVIYPNAAATSSSVSPAAAAAAAVAAAAAATAMSLPVPVPVPMPVPVPSAVPPVVVASSAATTATAAMSPLPLSLPLPLSVPLPVPVPLPLTSTSYPRPDAALPAQKVSVHPVYNYEAILETRRKEKEERKRLREIHRREKERKRIERVNRRALRLLEKKTLNTRQVESGNSLDRRKLPTVIDQSVIKALREGEESKDTDPRIALSSAMEAEEEAEAEADAEAEEDSTLDPHTDTTISVIPTATEDEDGPQEEEEDEEEEEEEAEAETEAEAEAEIDVDDDEDEEEYVEDDEDDEEEDEVAKSRAFNRGAELDDGTSVGADEEKVELQVESKNWPPLPPPPIKGILVSPGFTKDLLSNGNADDSSVFGDEPEIDDNVGDVESNGGNELNKVSEDKASRLQASSSKRRSFRSLERRSKKSVQFADGIKPGEGTSPSGGEGDMPSPPPPATAISRDVLRDMKRSRSRKSRKKLKRLKPQKTKKKVKVKIIKLKKPRITPLTAMMMEDSDELDDRSPPPPPPGSPPPPHLWPSYLSAYNTTSVRSTESQQPPSLAPMTTSVQPPPPTPLPLLVPPPPLNYTIQPCSKA